MLTENEIDRIANAIHALRPDWPANSLRSLIADPKLATKTRRDVTVALAWVACESETKTPGRVLENGPWWRAAVASDDRVPRNPMPHEECGTHKGQFRLSCSGCHSEKLAPVVPIRGKATAADVKAALRLAKSENCSHGVKPDRCLLKHDSPEEVAAYHQAVQEARAELETEGS
jgi:hypothetical protein